MGKTKKRYNGFIVAIALLVLLSSLLFIGLLNTTTTASAYAMQLENVYQKAFSELVTNVNNIEVDLSKILVSGGNETRKDLYEQVYTNCTYAGSNLSQLPLNHQSINSTTTFINQMGGFSYYAGQKLESGEDLSTADVNSTQELYNMCVYIQNILNDFVTSINYNFSILAQSVDVETSGFTTMFESMQAEGVKYPTLIYDGPFSQSTTQKEVKGLPSNEVSQEEAQKVIEKVYGSVSDLKFEGNTTGTFETYNFSFTTETGKSFYAQVTKRGGLLLNVTSYGVNDTDEALSLTQCKAKAEEFAKNLGLDVESVWATTLSGMAYINLTPVVGSVIIYPDMIKVKVSTSTGEILGWEATSYAYNHIERTNLVTTISLDEARKKVGSQLAIQTERIALIPQDYNKETLTYEFMCTFDEATYYVYIDATTGIETQVLKIIETTNGELLQ